MNIKIWRVLLFVLIIIGSTVVIYPFPRDMVKLYLEGGELAKASDLLDQLLAENPDDLGLLTLASDVFLVRGQPDKSIASLKKVLEQKPNDKTALEKLVRVYEWNVMPREAIQVWEQLAALEPENLKPLEQLVMYYRYYDRLEHEVDAIVRLNRLQSSRLFADFFIKELNFEVEKLSLERDKKNGDQVLDYLIRQIFVVGEQFRVALSDEDKVNVMEYITYVLEYYVGMDHIQEGYEYALRMDQARGGTVESRLRFAVVLGWFRQYEKALAILDPLKKIEPDNVELIRETANLARAAGRLEVAEQALEKLVLLEPENTGHQEELGQVYMQTGKHSKAVELFRRLAEKLDSWFKYAHDMLRAALFSSDKKLMAEVISDTSDVDISDSEYLRTKADILLALERPMDAYPVLKNLVQGPDARIVDFERMLDAAAVSKDKELAAEAVKLALEFDPENISLMRKSALAWREAGEFQKSYTLYRKVAGRDKLEEDIINMLLAASDTKDLKTARSAARYASELAPDNVKVIAQSGEIMLWLNSPADAYPYYRKAAIITGGDRDYVMSLIQVASFTRDKKTFRDAAETAIKLRPYDEEVALLAAAVWAASGDSVKASRLIAEFAGRGEKNMDTLLKWAQLADDAGLSEEAYRIYDRLYALNYKKKQVRKELARLAGWTNRPAEAALFYGEMSDEDPRNIELALQAAQSFSDAGDYDKSVAYYKRAIALRPGDYKLKLDLARTYGFGGMESERIALFEELWEAGQLPEEQMIELARAFIDERRPKPALDILEPYARLEKLPRFEGFLLASALQQAGRGTEASAVYKRLGKEYADDEVFLARLGAEALFNNFDDDAYSLFEKTLKLNRDNHTALKGLGIIFGEREQYKRAVARLRHYLRLVPDDAEGRYQLGEIYRLMGREADAVRQFRLAERAIRRKGGQDILKNNIKLMNR